MKLVFIDRPLGISDSLDVAQGSILRTRSLLQDWNFHYD